jgi:hypothetical protein
MSRLLLAKTSRSIRMEIIHALFSRLRRGDPTPLNLQRWAQEVSHAATYRHAEDVLPITVTRTMVSNYWRPYLKERGLRMRIGRPPVDESLKQERLKAIEEAAGDLASAVAKIQGLTSSDSVRVWRWRERKRHA